MKDLKKGFSILLVLAFICVFFVGATQFLMNENKNDTNVLHPTEIREYEGQRLSRIDDFRENSIKGPQYIDVESYRLLITGLVSQNVSYTYEDIITGYQKYEKVVSLYCVEGWDVTILWEGFLIKDLISGAGVVPEANVVIFYAYDGYSTSLPLDYVIENDIIIAFKMNNVTLTPARGFPFQLVAESKWGYKWIKWITKIELSNDVDYRGYWESRGYSNTADLNEYYFEEETYLYP